MTEIGKNSKHGPTHEKDGDDEVEATGLTGRCDFVDRGDGSSWDFTKTDLPVLDEWKELDLSAIVPAGTKAVLLTMQLNANVAGGLMYLRKKGNTNLFNLLWCTTQAANVYVSLEGICPISTDRKLEYYKSSVTWANSDIFIKGWFI